MEALPKTNAILADAILRDAGILATAEKAFPGTRKAGLVIHNAIVVRYRDAVDGGGRMPVRGSGRGTLHSLPPHLLSFNLHRYS